MVKQDGKGPKFRGKGAETRHMVPFGVVLAEQMATAAGGDNVFYNQLLTMMGHLLGFYTTFGEYPYNAEKASESCRQFCLLYSYFHKKSTDEKVWAIKPKFHLFVHLAEDQAQTSGDPSRFWAYMDEDFVGYISTIALSRGGKRIATTVPINVIDKYRSCT